MDQEKFESPEFYVNRIGDCCRMMCSPLFEGDRNSGGTPSPEFNMCAAHLCYCCECVLCHGLKETTGSFFYAGKPRLIDILGAIPSSMPKTERAAGAIMLNEAKMRAKTANGKARALIRELLNKGSFTEWLSTLNMSSALLTRYYDPSALVANYDHVETINRQIDELTKLVYFSYSLTDMDLGVDNYWALHTDVTGYVPRSELASVTIMSLLSDDNVQLLQVQAMLDARRQHHWLRDLVPQAATHAEALVRAGPGAGVTPIVVTRRHAVLTCALLRARNVGVDLPALTGAASACNALLRARAEERHMRDALIPSAVGAEALIRGVQVVAPMRRLCGAAAEVQGLVRGEALHRRHGAEVAQGLLRERLLRYERATEVAQSLVRATLLAHESAAEVAQGLIRASAAPDVCGAIAGVYGLLSAARECDLRERRVAAARECAALLRAQEGEAKYARLCIAARYSQAMVRCAGETALRAQGVDAGAIPAQAALRGRLAHSRFAELLCATQAAQGLVRRKRAGSAELSVTEAAAAACTAQGLMTARAQRAGYVHEIAVGDAQAMVAAALRRVEYHTAHAASAVQSVLRQSAATRMYRKSTAILAVQGLFRGARARSAHAQRCAAAAEAGALAVAASNSRTFGMKRAAVSEAVALRKSGLFEKRLRDAVAAASECKGLMKLRYSGEPDIGVLTDACVIVQGYVRDGIAERRKEEEKKRKLLELEKRKTPQKPSATGKSESFGGKTISIMNDYTTVKDAPPPIEPIYEEPISRPNWVPDDQSEDCCLCRSHFNIFNRKVYNIT